MDLSLGGCGDRIILNLSDKAKNLASAFFTAGKHYNARSICACHERLISINSEGSRIIYNPWWGEGKIGVLDFMNVERSLREITTVINDPYLFKNKIIGRLPYRIHKRPVPPELAGPSNFIMNYEFIIGIKVITPICCLQPAADVDSSTKMIILNITRCNYAADEARGIVDLYSCRGLDLIIIIGISEGDMQCLGTEVMYTDGR